MVGAVVVGSKAVEEGSPAAVHSTLEVVAFTYPGPQSC